MRRLPQPYAMLISILLVPLLLGMLGCWERVRAQRSVVDYAAAVVSLPQQVREMRELGARDSSASVDLGNPDTVYAPALAADMVEARLPSVRRSLVLARVQGPLALSVIGGSLLALLCGAIGLAAAQIAARRAMVSRDVLVASFAALQRALPLVLGGMVIGLALAVVCGVLFELISLWSSVSLLGGGVKLMFAGVVLATMAVWTAWSAIAALREVVALYTPQPGAVTGRAVSVDEAPALWRFVEDIARRQQAIAPDTLVLGLTQGFYVTEQDLVLSPGDRAVSGRTLYLPAPYLQFLDEKEVAAIVGHELAHFTGEDTAYSRRFAPLYAGMERALAAMHADANGLLLLRGPLQLADHMMERFDLTVRHWSRLREFEADRLGALVSGGRPAASALVRTAVVAPPVDTVLENALAYPPEDDADLVAMMAQMVDEKGWPDIRAYLEDVQSHPTDTHPPTPERIQRLDVALDAALLETALRAPREGPRPAGERLIDDWHVVCRRLSSDYLAEARGAHARHRQYLEETAAAVPQEAVTLYNNVASVSWVQFGVAAMFAAIGVAIWIFRRAIGFGHDAFVVWLILGICSAAVVIGVVAGIMTRRSGQTPYLILLPETLSAPKLSAPIAWRDVENWGVVYGTRFALDLILEDDVVLPHAQRFARGTRVHKRKRLVSIGAYGVRGMSVEDFQQVIERYVEADQARRVLAER